jgi:glucan biosynthesis protein C
MDIKSPPRHYEIDALRVIALGLLILYHIFVCYQPFANMLMFLQYDQLLEKYWFIGELVNIWRIPVLFLVSGMAVGFILGRRTITELLCDRMMRIVPPLCFGSLVIWPVFPALYALYEGRPPSYLPSPGHLWFLQNLVSYTVLLLPLFVYMKGRPDNAMVRALRRLLPLGLLVALPLPLMLETALSQPDSFSFFPVRFGYGLVCYAAGFLLVSVGEKFWTSIGKVCHLALPLAVLFYLGRIEVIEWGPLQDNHWTTGFESGLWMLAFLGYGSLFLNRPSRVFAYLNKAVFPIYIIHMPVQQAVACVIYGWKLGPELTFLLHALFTFAICGLAYEWVIRRIRWLYPVMGLKAAPRQAPQPGQPPGAGGWAKFGTGLTLFVLAPLLVLSQLVIVMFMTLSQWGGSADAHQPAAGASDSLWAAAKNNDVEQLNAFIEAGETPIDKPDAKYTLPALNLAALNGSAEAVQALVKAGADVNVRTGDDSTPLGHAAFMGHPDIVAFLIEQGAELNTVNHHKSTPLDSTYAEWKVVIWVAKMVDLTVERERWETGRIEARERLKEKGGKRTAELE